jgi:hypothetical protein
MYNVKGFLILHFTLCIYNVSNNRKIIYTGWY